MGVTASMAVDAHARLRRLAAAGFARHATRTDLAIPTPETIRAGLAGGLPFDSLTTDVALGCLAATKVCYGNCFAARGAFDAGVDFAVRVPTILDEAQFIDDLDRVAAAQRHMRNGWNSDPSWDWPKAARIAELVHASGRLPIFITKSFTAIAPTVMRRLVAVEAEMRISVSAFDTDAQLRHRCRTAEVYRAAGGVAVPVVMSAAFVDEELRERQDAIVADFVARDFPTAENSLRFDPASPVLAAIDRDRTRPVAGSGDIWSGRLYLDLEVPTMTSLSPSYRGMRSGRLSELDRDELASIWHEPVHTHEEVMSGPPLSRPKQCGVPLQWSRHAVQ